MIILFKQKQKSFLICGFGPLTGDFCLYNSVQYCNCKNNYNPFLRANRKKKRERERKKKEKEEREREREKEKEERERERYSRGQYSFFSKVITYICIIFIYLLVRRGLT
jgi:hypothetical protein